MRIKAGTSSTRLPVEHSEPTTPCPGGARCPESLRNPPSTYDFPPQNFHRFSGANTLAALVSGAAARAAEDAPAEELRDAALAVLRSIHPGVEVPEPVAYTVSKWASGAVACVRGVQQRTGCGAPCAGQCCLASWPQCVTAHTTQA